MSKCRRSTLIRTRTTGSKSASTDRDQGVVMQRGKQADWGAIRSELLAMAEEDLRVRSELAADGSLFGTYHPRMRAVHDVHASRLASMFEQWGWPGEPQVGADGAKAAWLIVQHAIA